MLLNSLANRSAAARIFRVDAKDIVCVEEWPHVVFVRFAHKRAKFVSKKTFLADAENLRQRNAFNARVQCQTNGIFIDVLTKGSHQWHTVKHTTTGFLCDCQDSQFQHLVECKHIKAVRESLESDLVAA